jgi:diguanylate cyclase (GGDEF)-like protein/PAS domain S-box-containing protein
MDDPSPPQTPEPPTTLAQFQQMLDAAERLAQLGHWCLDIATQRPVWSPQVFAIFRRDPALGEPSFVEHAPYIHPEDWPTFERAVDACTQTHQPYDLRLRIRRDDGTEGHIRVYGVAFTEGEGSASKLVGFVVDVTQQTALEAALRKREADYRLLIEHQTDLVVKVDVDGRFLFVSPSYCRTFGKTEQELIGSRFMPLVHPEDREATAAAMAALEQPPYRCYLEQRAMTVSGWRWFGWSDSALLDTQGNITAIIGTGRDIHERKLAELALQSTRRTLDLALESGGIGTYRADFTTGAVEVDARYLAQLGYAPGEIEVTHAWWRARVHPEDLAAFADQSARVLSGGLDDFMAEYRFQHRAGHWLWLQDHSRVFERSAEGTALAASGLRIDVTRRKEAELKLAHNAEHDPLTDLLNRRGMWRAIRHVHAQGLRTARPHCIAILDLDHFKRVNDVHGHLVGDSLLRDIAQQLLANARDADWIARWGGEEFLILMPDTSGPQALTFIERLRQRLAETPFQLDSRTIHITASAGIAACRLDQDSEDQVVSRADQALYDAKREGRNRVCADLSLGTPSRQAGPTRLGRAE